MIGPIHTELVARYADAYRQMAAAGYRPAAPSDGAGHITVPLAELDLDAEAEEYGMHFCAEENTCRFWIGCSEFSTDKAFVFTIEAARLLCAKVPGSRDKNLAVTLLKMAVAECNRAEKASKAVQS